MGDASPLRIADEGARLRALAEYDLYDTPAEPEFDRLVELAAHVMKAPIALISLVGHDDIFFKARTGLKARRAPRQDSLCGAALACDGVFVVSDAAADARFARNTFVAGYPNVRFYAGVPLVTPSGHAIGAICIVDTVARTEVDAADARSLRDIAELVMREMELRRLRKVEDKAARALKALEESDRRFRILVQGVKDYALVTLDPAGIVTTWNAGAQRINGYCREEVVGRHFSIFHPDADRAAGLPQTALQTALRDGRFEVEAQRVRKDGSRYWANVIIEPIRDQEGGLIGFAKITRDVTQRRRDEERLRKLAHFDTLTGLLNRFSMLSRLEHRLAEGRRPALLMLDLNGFKQVNDTLGHSAGDHVLKIAAERIREAVGSDGEAGRLGGDEFAVLVYQAADPCMLAARCRALLDSFRVPIVRDGQEIYLGLAIGLAESGDGISGEDLLVHADLALQEAKTADKYAWRRFEPRMQEAVVSRRNLELDLRHAVGRDEFELHFQPQVRMASRRIVGAEALLRWRHPVRGLLTPGAFLSVLEHGTLTQAVGNWVIATACAHAAAARQAGLAEYCVSVNLFGTQLRAGNLARTIGDTLEACRLPPDALEIEVTENVALDRDEAVASTLQSLSEMGLGIAFDDYGTGYASLSMLKQVPLTRLKIDTSFVRNVCIDRRDAAVVRAVLDLARGFNLKVTAEGIETEEQALALVEMGCGDGQGYFFGRPMPAEEMMARVVQQAGPVPARTRRRRAHA